LKVTLGPEVAPLHVARAGRRRGVEFDKLDLSVGNKGQGMHLFFLQVSAMAAHEYVITPAPAP
jgi:hypothetical protein